MSVAVTSVEVTSVAVTLVADSVSAVAVPVKLGDALGAEAEKADAMASNSVVNSEPRTTLLGSLAERESFAPKFVVGV